MTALLPQHIAIINVDDSIALFLHTETLQIYPFSRDNIILKFLTCFQEKGAIETNKVYGDEQYNQFYGYVLQKLSEAPTSADGKPTDKPTFATINLPISNQCNLNCPYCFAQTEGGFHFDNYSQKDIENVIESIITMSSLDEYSLVFFGGEPLLNVDIIKYTIDYVHEHYKEKKFHFSMTTNGTIITPSIIALLKENNIQVLVSIDGPDNDYNFRFFRNGRKSIDVVLANIKVIQNSGIQVMARATLVNTNPHIFETFKFFEDELQIPFAIEFVQESENTAHDFDKYDATIVNNIKTQLAQVEQYYIEKIQSNQDIRNYELIRRIEILRYRQKKHVCCGAGNSYFTITAQGDVFTCPMFMNSKEHVIGNINEQIDNEKLVAYNSTSVDKMGECRNCWAKYLCNGGCVAQKIICGKKNSQSLLEGDCYLQQTIWEFYIRLYYYIMKYAPQYLIKEQTVKTTSVC